MAFVPYLVIYGLVCNAEAVIRHSRFRGNDFGAICKTVFNGIELPNNCHRTECDALLTQDLTPVAESRFLYMPIVYGQKSNSADLVRSINAEFIFDISAVGLDRVDGNIGALCDFRPFQSIAYQFEYFKFTVG